MTIEQMKSFSEDKEFINKLIIQETDEDVKKVFKSRGVELTDEDVEDLKNLTKMCVENKVELPEEILENVKQRDFNDSNREISPLRKAEDAILVDSTYMTIEEVAQRIMDIIKEVKEQC